MGADDTSRDLYHWNGRVSTMKTMGYFWFCFTNTKLHYCTDEGAITASLCSMAGLRLRFLLHPPTPTPAQGAPLLAGIACVRSRQSSECLSQPTGWSGLLEDRDCDWSILWVYWPHEGRSSLGHPILIVKRDKWSEEMAEKSALCVWAGLFPTGACSNITFFGCPHGTQAPADGCSCRGCQRLTSSLMCSTCSSSSSFLSVSVLFFFSNDWPIRAANSRSRSFCERQKWEQKLRKPMHPAGAHRTPCQWKKTKLFSNNNGLLIHHPRTGLWYMFKEQLTQWHGPQTMKGNLPILWKQVSSCRKKKKNMLPKTFLCNCFLSLCNHLITCLPTCGLGYSHMSAQQRETLGNYLRDEWVNPEIPSVLK